MKFIFLIYLDDASYMAKKNYPTSHLCLRWQTSEKKEDILQNRLIKFKELLSAKF
jgi:hypothetical protein